MPTRPSAPRPTATPARGRVYGSVLEVIGATPLVRLPRIEQRDVFALAAETRRYDVVVASMVINCVPTPEGGASLGAKCARWFTLTFHSTTHQIEGRCC